MESFFTNESVKPASLVMRNPCRLQSTFGQWLLYLFKILKKKKPAHKLLYLALVFPNILYKIEVLESMGSCPVAVALQPRLRMKEYVNCFIVI